MHGIMSHANGTTNGQQFTEQQTERFLTAEPLAGYTPNLPIFSLFGDDTRPRYQEVLRDVEAMLTHPRVAICNAYLKAGIAGMEIEVRASSSKIEEFVATEWDRFFTRSRRQAQYSYDFGRLGMGARYCTEGALLRFDSAVPLHPLDCVVLTRARQYVGFRVRAAGTEKPIMDLRGPNGFRPGSPAHGLWLVHNQRFWPWYGWTQLYGAHRPWKRLATRDGAEEIIDGGVYRYAYAGPIVRFPQEDHKRGANSAPGADPESGRQKAREIHEGVKAGAGIALSSVKYSSEQGGDYKWSVEWPQHVLDVAPLLTYAGDLEKQISLGIGVPSELLEASEVGSGYSGRAIPLEGFLTARQDDADELVRAWKEQIGEPLVRWNFGEGHWFDVKVKPLLQSKMAQMQQQPTPNPGQPPGQPGAAAAGDEQGQGFTGTKQDSRGRTYHWQNGHRVSGQLQFATEEGAPLHWGDLVTKEIPHVRIVGGTGTGKTTVAQALAQKADGKLFVIDPLWTPGSWGGLPAATVDAEGSYGPIRLAIDGLLDEMKRRGGRLQHGEKDFERLTVLFDEVPDTVSELPDEAGLLIRRLGQRGRHGNIHLVGIGQSDRVGSWGIEGFGDAAENFATVYLGEKAIAAMPETADEEWPAVLEWKGKRHALSLDGVKELAEQPIDPARAFTLSGDGNFQMATGAHAPKGYTKDKPLQIGGKTYVGGEFIPGDVLAKATQEEKAKLQSKPGGENHKTKSHAFKAWFGDWENDPDNASKVVKKDGSPAETYPVPIAVYHGSATRFNSFQQGESPGIAGYFSESEEYAQRYGDVVRPFYLNIRRPLDLRNQEGKKTVAEWLEVFQAAGVDTSKVDFDADFYPKEKMPYWGLLDAAAGNVGQKSNFVAELQRQGFDGISGHEGGSPAYAVFKPNQIKSVDNHGAFDPNNDDVRLATTDQPADDPAKANIVNRAAIALEALSALAKQDLADALRKGTLAQQLASARRVVERYKPLLARMLTDAQLAAALAGMRRVATVIPTDPATIQLVPDQPTQEEAAPVTFPTIQEAVTHLAARRLVTPAEYAELEGQAKADAFSVANVETEVVLDKIRGALTEAVAKGEDFGDFQAKVEADLAPGTFLSPAHTETVFRAAVHGAYSVGQDKVLSHPVVGHLFPYAEVFATHDDRARPEHLAMEQHGIQGTSIYRRDDPVFQKFKGPWDYGCRCFWTAISVDEAARRGIHEAIDYQRTGVWPEAKAWVTPPPFEPSPSWRREGDLLMSLQEAGIVLATKDEGRWVTIGGKKDEDGKRKGGSPVFIQNGRITKGHPSLTGKKIAALKEEGDDPSTHRQQVNQFKGHARAVWGKKARKEGIDPASLHQLAAEVLGHNRGHVADHNRMLAEARKALSVYGGQWKTLKQHADKTGGDADRIKGMDKAAQEISRQYPEAFGEHDTPSERLYELLAEGNREPMSEEDAYEQSFEHLMEMKARHRVQDVPFEGQFSTAELPDHRALAEFYADLWNLFAQAKQPIPERELHQVGEELAGGDWVLRHDADADRWEVVHADEHHKAGLEMAVAHAPRGGVSIAGKEYRGGQFIPKSQLEKATPEVQEAVKAASQPGAEKRRARGSVDAAKLSERVRPHADTELSERASVSAKRSYNALRAHHGDLLLHRLEELIGDVEAAHAAVKDNPEQEGVAQQFRERLKAYGQMVEWAQGHGITGEVKAKYGPNVSESDIPYSAAYNAHRGTSFVPETRAKQRQKDFVDTMTHDWESLAEKADTEEKQAQLQEEFDRYKQGYKEKYLDYLHANSRVMSAMIVGPAKFPTAANEKKSDIAHKRLTELLEYRKKALEVIRRKLTPELQPIKSADSDAVERYRQKLSAHEALQEKMKAVNDAHKKFLKDPSSLEASGLTDADKEKIRNYKPAYSWEPHPYPPYALTNNNKEIRRIKARIEEVSAMQASEHKEEQYGDVKVVENPDAGRIQVVFPGKPDEKTRELLKQSGFRWAPSEGAWQRHLNNGGRYAVERVMKQLGKEKTVASPTEEEDKGPSIEPVEIEPAAAPDSEPAGVAEPAVEATGQGVREKDLSDHAAALQSIPVGELHTVAGFKVRRTGDNEYRVETQTGTGNVHGDAAKILDHIQRQQTSDKMYGKLRTEALARAAAHNEPSFLEADRVDEATRAFAGLPAGTPVVSLEEGTHGRTGKIVKDDMGRNRVKLDGEDGYASNFVEPLEAKHSWRVSAEERQQREAAQANTPQQGGLFEQTAPSSVELPPEDEKPAATEEIHARQASDERPARSPDAGTSGSGSTGGDAGRTGTEPASTPRIITARQQFTKAHDPALVPEGVRQHLNETQQQGAALAIDAIEKHGGFLLADGTGTGKTRQQLAVAKHFLDKGKKVVVVAPAEVIKPDWKKGTMSGSWANDAGAMGVPATLVKGDAGVKPGSVHLTTYNELGKLKEHIDKDTVLLFDESHFMKNRDSARHKHGKEAIEKAAGVLYATATPADKPLHIAHLARAGVFGNVGSTKTYEKLGMKLVNQHIGGGQYRKVWQIDPKVGYKEATRRLAGLFDQMTKDGLMVKRELSMHGVGFQTDHATLTTEQHDEIQKVYDDVLAKTDGNKAVALMAARLHQEPMKIPQTVAMAQEELAAGRSPVIFVGRVNDIGEEGEGEDGDKDVRSHGTAAALKKALIAAGIPESDIGELHGGATKTADQKKRSMNDFQANKKKVMIATIQSGGTGINLDDTTGERPRTMIMVTPPFTANDMAQAVGRVHRLNTKSAARIRGVLSDSAIDDWNAKVLASKFQTMGAVVGGETLRGQEAIRPEGMPDVDTESSEPFDWGESLQHVPKHYHNTPYAHNDLIGQFGGRRTNRGGDWTTEFPSKEHFERYREHVAKQEDERARARAAEQAKTPPRPAEVVTDAAPEKPAYMSAERKAAIHDALRQLAANDTDRASERNQVGFNQMDSEFGSQLAGQGSLTDKQAHAAAKMLSKYHRQLDADLHKKVTTQEEEPAKPASEPPSAKPEASSLPVKKATTSRGTRYVHSFAAAGDKFWDIYKKRKPEYLSVYKDKYTGRWEASIWGATEDEVRKNAEHLKSLGLQLSTAESLEFSTEPLDFATAIGLDPLRVPAAVLQAAVERWGRPDPEVRRVLGAIADRERRRQSGTGVDANDRWRVGQLLVRLGLS